MFLVVGNLVQRLFQFGADQELLRRRIVLDAQNVRLAADLAVFDVALPLPGRLVDGSGVPFSAGGALETGFHGVERAYLSGYIRSPHPISQKVGYRAKDDHLG